MKLTESQLRRIIREELRGISSKKMIKESSSKDAYSRLKELRKEYNRDFYHLKFISQDEYQEIYDLLKTSEKNRNSYDSFLEKVRKIIQPGAAYSAFFENKGFNLPYDEIIRLMKEHDSLSQRFVTKNVSDETDRAYGRKRFQVVDKETNEVVDEFTDRKGSLGS